MKAISDATFNKIVAGNPNPVLVDFWAGWCPPCKAITPILESFAKKYPTVLFVKLNIDRSPKTTEQYRVRSIPTLIILKNGKVKGRMVGAGTRREIQRFIELHM